MHQPRLPGLHRGRRHPLRRRAAVPFPRPQRRRPIRAGCVPRARRRDDRERARRRACALLPIRDRPPAHVHGGDGDFARLRRQRHARGVVPQVPARSAPVEAIQRRPRLLRARAGKLPRRPSRRVQHRRKRHVDRRHRDRRVRRERRVASTVPSPRRRRRPPRSVGARPAVRRPPPRRRRLRRLAAVRAVRGLRVPRRGGTFADVAGRRGGVERRGAGRGWSRFQRGARGVFHSRGL